MKRIIDLDLQPGGHLDLALQAGRATVRPAAEGEQPRLELEFGEGEPSVDCAGDAQRAKITISGLSGSWFASLQALVVVPVDTSATIEAHAGSVVGSGLRRRVRAIAGAGSVRLTDVTGDLEFVAQAGSITVAGAAGIIKARAEAGSVQIDAIRLDPGEHTFQAHAGSVRVSIPEDTAIAVTSEASLGSVRVAAEEKEDSPIRVLAQAYTGSVRITAGAKFEDRLRARHTGREHRQDRRWARLDDFGPAVGAAAVRISKVFTGGAEQPADPSPETMRILSMVESGKITAKEAAELLAALRR